MKKFRFRYSPLVWVLLSVVLIICVIGLSLNILNIIEYSFAKGYKLFSYIALCVMTGFVIVFVLSVFIYGRYVIKKHALYTYFGFIYTKTDIKDIVQITHFKKSDKLVLYFSDQKYSVIVISPTEYERFILELRKENPQIIYTSEIDGEQMPE